MILIKMEIGYNGESFDDFSQKKVWQSCRKAVTQSYRGFRFDEVSQLHLRSYPLWDKGRMRLAFILSKNVEATENRRVGNER